MSPLFPLLARDRYSDEEWALSSTGHCDWVIETGTGPRVVHCDKPSSPTSFYRWCAHHDHMARDNNPQTYGQ
jgi:hypothetical protein